LAHYQTVLPDNRWGTKNAVSK